MWSQVLLLHVLLRAGALPPGTSGGLRTPVFALFHLSCTRHNNHQWEEKLSRENPPREPSAWETYIP